MRVAFALPPRHPVRESGMFPLSILHMENPMIRYLFCICVLLTGVIASASDADVRSAEKAYEGGVEKAKADYDRLVKAAQADCDAKVKAAQAEYDSKAKIAQATYDTKMKDLSKPFLVVLQKEVDTATKSGNLDRAIKLRDAIKDITSGIPTTQPGRSLKSGICDIVVSANNSYIMYINGERVLQGEKDPKQIRMKIAINDVITVKAINTWDPMGFICIMIFKDEKLEIITSTKSWKSYTPKDLKKWFDPSGISERVDAQLGRTDIVVPAMEKVILGDEQSIWGSGKECYLTLTVTKDVMQDLNVSAPKAVHK